MHAVHRAESALVRAEPPPQPGVAINAAGQIPDAIHFLERHDIGIVRGDHIRDARQRGQAVEVEALVDVVVEHAKLARRGRHRALRGGGGTKLSSTPASPTRPTAAGERRARILVAPDARSAGSATARTATGHTYVAVRF